jgi:putative transcriptional regulator
MDDRNFRQTVVVMCEHSGEGAFGLVVNRVLMKSFLPLLHTFDIGKSAVDMPVYYGGPVKPEHGYIIYAPCGRKYDSIRIGKGLAVTAAREMLRDIASGRGPDKFLFALGFSGWGANQLEDELMTDSWLVSPAEPGIIFDVPAHERWKRAAGLIGVDFFRFSERSGNA